MSRWDVSFIIVAVDCAISRYLEVHKRKRREATRSAPIPRRLFVLFSKPAGLADGLGLRSVLRECTRFAPCLALQDRWFPRATHLRSIACEQLRQTDCQQREDYEVTYKGGVKSS
jgi:hypothetical protein